MDGDSDAPANEKNKYLAAGLAWFGGLVGAQWHYLDEPEQRNLCLKYCWTLIPVILGIRDALRFVSMDDEEFDRLASMSDEERERATTERKTREVREALGEDALDGAEGQFVTPENVAEMADVLDEGETVAYLAKGSTIDVEGSGSGTSLLGDDRGRKVATDGLVTTAFTDRRVVVKVPQQFGDDERSVPYHSITSVDLDTGMATKRITLQTAGATYHIGASQPDADEVREALGYVRERIAEANDSGGGSEDHDPTEQLKNLNELYEAGSITEEEYEEKKAALLDRIG